MRYPDGGGLTAPARAKREQLRQQPAGWIADGVRVPEVTRRQRVSQAAVYGVAATLAGRWARRLGVGRAAREPLPRLDEARLSRLVDALDEGPAVHRFDADQRWALASVSDLIARMFHIRYTLRGTANILPAGRGGARCPDRRWTAWQSPR